MSYSAKHRSFQESLWLKEWKFQAAVKNSDVCCSCPSSGRWRNHHRQPVVQPLRVVSPRCLQAPAPGAPDATHCPCAPAVPLPPAPQDAWLSPSFPQGSAATGKLQEGVDLGWTWPWHWKWGSFRRQSTLQSQNRWTQGQGSGSSTHPWPKERSGAVEDLPPGSTPRQHENTSAGWQKLGNSLQGKGSPDPTQVNTHPYFLHYINSISMLLRVSRSL